MQRIKMETKTLLITMVWTTSVLKLSTQPQHESLIRPLTTKIVHAIFALILVMPVMNILIPGHTFLELYNMLLWTPEFQIYLTL